MVSAADLAEVDFLAELPQWAREELARHAHRVRFGAGDVITRQHEKADTAHVLTHGSVEVLLRFDGTGDLLIGTLTEAAPTLGWSAFRPPYRYTASIRCQGPCSTIAIPRQGFEELFQIDPGLEIPLLRRVAGVVADRLERTVDLLLGRPSAADDYIGGPVVGPRPGPAAATDGPARGELPDEVLAVLEDAPFFEHFSRVELDALAQRAHVADHAAGHHIVHLGAAADSFHMLISGTARLVYTDEAPATPGEAFSSQTITEPGRVIGWSALVEPFRYRAGALAATRCRTMVFDHNELLGLAAEHPGFGRRLMLQVLWLLGNRLRETRMRMIARRYDD